MIAKKFSLYRTKEAFLIFASGISNSKSTNEEDYQRETELLLNTIRQNINSHFVYFSTCSIYDATENASRYVLHKLKIESYIQSEVPLYTIFRVSNLVGQSANPTTILNFLYTHITQNIKFDLWSHSSRNLIDIDDMYLITDYLISKGIGKNSIINIANPVSYSATKIVAEIEAITGTKASYTLLLKGGHFSIDVSLILPVIEQLGIDFNEFYLSNLIKKYYLHK